MTLWTLTFGVMASSLISESETSHDHDHDHMLIDCLLATSKSDSIFLTRLTLLKSYNICSPLSKTAPQDYLQQLPKKRPW